MTNSPTKKTATSKEVSAASLQVTKVFIYVVLAVAVVAAMPFLVGLYRWAFGL